MSDVDRNAQPVVWYNPEDPSQIALSWSVDLGIGRLAFASFHWILGLVVLGLFFLGIKSSIRKISHYRACAANSTRKLFEAVSTPLLDKDGKNLGLTTYKYLYQKSDGSNDIIPIGYSPLLLNQGDKKYVVGLESTKYPKKPIILSSSLYEFDLSSAEKDALLNFGPEINSQV